MGAFVKIGSASDVAEGCGKVFAVDGREVAVFRVGGTCYALDNTCPHAGGPLGEGTLQGHHVVCPWHGFQFHVATGVNPVYVSQRVAPIPCRVQGNDLMVDPS